MSSDVQYVSLIGTGNVAKRLGYAFIENGIRVVDVYGRNEGKAIQLANDLGAANRSKTQELEGQLLVVCTSDDSVPMVIESLAKNKRIAYTSGSVELSLFNDYQSIGVLYPLQTLSSEKPVDFQQVPMLIEASSPAFKQELVQIASCISSHVSEADSATRKRYHLAAVWVNNFTNHLFSKAKQICDSNDLTWQYLYPLMQETINKAMEIGPELAQTGPARRQDQLIIQQHLQLLTQEDQILYKLLSESIQKNYTK